MRETLQANNPVVLDASGISKSFGGARALDNVSLQLRAGEVHALMGENGAGKSTLIKVLSGIHRPDTGELRLEGKTINPKSNFEAQELGISTVFQEVNLIPSLTVAENIFLGREPKKWGRIDWKAMEEGAKKSLARLDLDLDVTRPLEDYPIALQQMTAIARALDLEAKVLILDEATSSLAHEEVERLFDVLRRLKAQGLAIVFISHFLDQIEAICDRWTVLRNGKLVGEWKSNELSRTELVAKMMGRELAHFEREQKVVSKVRQPWIKVTGLKRAPSYGPYDLEMENGETQGLAGLLGSGRTEFARLLFGLDKATEGSIQIDGKEVSFKNPQEAIEHGLAFVPEDRKHQSIFPQLSVRENIILALQARKGWAKMLSHKEQTAIADKWISALGIKTRDAEQPIETLSGGNQQKAILARWLALDPRLLVLDEPTRGIDVGAKAEILKLVAALAKEGKTTLFISSELEETVRACDRVSVIKDGKKIGELGPGQVNEDSILSAIGEAQ